MVSHLSLTHCDKQLPSISTGFKLGDTEYSWKVTIIIQFNLRRPFMFAFGFWFYFKLFVNLIFVAVESIFYSFLHLYKPCSIGATPTVPGKILTGSGEYSYRIWGDSYRIWGDSYRILGKILQDLVEIPTGFWGESYR